MNKTAKKVLAAVLSCSIVAGSVTCGVLADKAEDTDSKIVSVLDNLKKDETMSQRYQTETVYVISDNNGATQKVIVSDTMKDNTNGTESYSMQNVNAEAPVTINVKYELDGKEVSASEIAGKSGHVVITYDYKNNITSKVMVGDKEETMYIPFSVITGMLLDNEKFSKVEVTGGKLIDDGSRKAVLGLALPGLKENLGLSESDEKFADIDIPSQLVVEADVTDFSLGSVYSFVSNFDISGLSIDGEGSADLLSGGLNQVTDIMNQLLDGSLELAEGANKLSDGLVTAADGSKKLVDGVNAAHDGAAALAAGAKTAYEGSSALAAGAGTAYTGSTTLDGGIGTLKEGLDTLDSNSEALTSGAKQVFATLLSTADAELAKAGLEVPALTIENYSTVIDGVVAKISATDAEQIAKASVEAKVNENRSAVESAVTEAVKQQVLEQILTAAGMNDETYKAALAAGKIPSETQAQINGTLDAQMKSEQIKGLIKKNTDEQCEVLVKQYMASEDVKNQIKDGEKTIKESVEKLQGLKGSLDSYNTFYQGIITYTKGVASAAAGADQLKNGSTALAGGLKELSTGAATLEGGLKDLSEGAATLDGGLKDLAEGNGTLYNGLVELRDGSKKLAEGADTLHNGLATVNDEVVSKLIAFINNNLSDAADRINAIAEVSSEYKSLNGLNGAEDGTVKFIYKTGEVK